MTDIIEDQHSYGVDIKNREIYLHGHHGSFEEDPGVDYRMASTFIKNIRSLDIDNQQAIIVHMHSVGGNWGDGMAIYDTMQYIKPAVSTLCFGQAASMGSFLLAAGEKGKRFALPNSRIMVHQPSASFQGQASDIEIHAKEIISVKTRINEIYSKLTGQSTEAIQKALDRDNFMTSDDAKAFGLVDDVVSKRQN